MKPSQYNHIEDKELIENFRKDGNNKWLGILLPRYTLMLYGVSMKYLKDEDLARDSVQQIFLKVLNELKKYKVDYFKSWLYTLAKNHCLAQLKSRGHYFHEVNDNLIKAGSDEEDLLRINEKERDLTNMNEALESLSIDQRTCITLFYLEKKSYQEVAEITNFTLGQVKSHIQNGKRNMRINLERMKDHE